VLTHAIAHQQGARRRAWNRNSSRATAPWQWHVAPIWIFYLFRGPRSIHTGQAEAPKAGRGTSRAQWVEYKTQFVRRPPNHIPLKVFLRKKILFTSLNYGSSLRFHLELENREFCLLKLTKPDIKPLWMGFLSVFSFFILYLFWMNI